MKHFVAIKMLALFLIFCPCCGPQRKHFWTCRLPFKFCCHNFHIHDVEKGGGMPPFPLPPPPRRVPQDPQFKFNPRTYKQSQLIAQNAIVFCDMYLQRLILGRAA